MPTRHARVSAIALVATLALAVGAADAVGAVRRRAPQLHYDGPTMTSAALVAQHRATRSTGLGRRTRQRFAGVGQRDVYNPSREFAIDGKTVMAARTESRDSETDTEVRFFEKRAGTWRPVAGAPRLALQDPFVSQHGNEVVVGGIQVVPRGKDLRYRTVFYRGTSLQGLRQFAVGPWGMKGIRLTQLDDGRILVLTRPQGAKGGRGKIAFTTIRSLDQLTPQTIGRARILEGLFDEAEWGGANDTIDLGDGRIGVLGHIARFDADRPAMGGHLPRSYYPIAFEIDLKSGKVSRPNLLAERRDLQGGLAGASKRPDLENVIYAGGIQRLPGGRARLSLGAGDAETHRVVTRDPFAR